MPVKSVVDIEVNDEQFKAFSALFDKYSSALGKTPGKWAAVSEEVSEVGKGFQGVMAAMLAQNELIRRTLSSQQTQSRNVREQATLWQGMSRSTSVVAGNITRATASLLRWTALTSVFSGLLGAGGLFGIDRLASGVSSGRRSSTGLGIGYGEQKSFDVNYGRLVDTGSFVSSVNEALHDVTKRVGLYGAGFTDSDLKGRNSAQVGSDLLGRIKRIADQTPEEQLAQVLKARGLDQFVDLQSAQRLKNTSPQEFRSLQQQYGKNQGGLDLDNSTALKWQNLDTQLELAGKQINNVFIKGITPLIDPLNKLSDSVAQAIKTFLASPRLGEWITDLGTGLQKAATYLGSDDFQSRIEKFVKSFGEVVDFTVKVAGYLPSVPKNPLTPLTPSEITAAKPNPWTGGGGGSADFTGTWRPRGNNPGNLRMPGASTGFASFPTEEAGLQAMASQLRRYQNRDGLDTIEKIINKYAPPSENNTKNYVGFVSGRSGYGPDQKLDLNNPEVLSKVMSAMTKMENSRSNYTPQAIVTVINNTGGSAITSTSQVAQ